MTDRLAIAGVPKAGKSTHANMVTNNGPLFHTDDANAGRDWSSASLEVSNWFDRPGPWVIEGVTVPRALRKWLVRNPAGKPVDRVMWFGAPLQKLTREQEIMGKGCRTVFEEITPELQRRGVELRLY